MWYSESVFIEGADAQTLSEGETVTLLNWGNVMVTRVTRYMAAVHTRLCHSSSTYIHHNPSPLRGDGGHVTSVEARLALDCTDYKNTQKMTWLARSGHAQTTPTVCVHYENVITKGVLKPDDDFKDHINYNSMVSGCGGCGECILIVPHLWYMCICIIPPDDL